MTIEEYEQRIQRLVERSKPLTISVSPDFQCDQSGGFPVSLNYSTPVGLAWLEPNSFMLDELEDDLQRTEVLQACADFGFRCCESNQEYNAILEELGEDAMQSAWLPEEDQEMGGIGL